MICSKCGFDADNDSAFCPKCGERLMVESTLDEESEKEARALLFGDETDNVKTDDDSPSGTISGTEVFALLDELYQKKHQNNSEPKTVPPVNTNAFVNPGKLKHNSESEKRIAVGNTLDKLKVLKENMLSSLNSDFRTVDNGLTRAESKKLSSTLRNEIKKTHDALKKMITSSEGTMKSLEQMLGSFGGKSKLLLDDVDSAWKEYDKLYQKFDNAINELIPLFKRGSLGSSESQYRKQQFNNWHSEIMAVINSIGMAENELAKCMMSYDFDTKIYMKAFNKVNVPGYKKDTSGTRFSSHNVWTLFLVILSWGFFVINMYSEVESTMSFHVVLSFCFGGTILGFYHFYRSKAFFRTIRDSLETAKEYWFLIIFPPALAIMCCVGLLALLCCIVAGFTLGWIFMFIDPIKILLGFQCVKDDDELLG